MKMRLPVHLMRLLVLLAGAVSSHAAVRHPDVSHITYVDFAINCGRFATGSTNALLEHIREREGGVRIHYQGGQSPYTLPHGMISFDSVADEGHITSVGPNYVVSVAHNATRLYPVFSGNELGAEHAPRYVTMEEYGAENRFVHHIFHGAMNDYKLARLCRVVTDAPAAAMTGGANAAVKGELVYRVWVVACNCCVGQMARILMRVFSPPIWWVVWPGWWIGQPPTMIRMCSWGWWSELLPGMPAA